MTRRSDVLTVKGWLRDADEVGSGPVPEGWEHGLLIVLTDADAPYYFFMTLVEPDAEHEKPRYFAGWCSKDVPMDTKPWRPGVTGDVRLHDTLPSARADLRRAYLERTPATAQAFEETWKRGVALFKEMRKNKEA